MKREQAPTLYAVTIAGKETDLICLTATSAALKALELQGEQAGPIDWQPWSGKRSKLFSH